MINWKQAERLVLSYGAGGKRDVSDPWELHKFKLTPLLSTSVVIANKRSVQLERTDIALPSEEKRAWHLQSPCLLLARNRELCPGKPHHGPRGQVMPFEGKVAVHTENDFPLSSHDYFHV